MKIVDVLGGFALGLGCCLAGCVSSGSIKMDSGTNVSLDRGNYRTIRTGALGTDTGFWLFGLIPFASPTYADAKQDLYESTGQNLEGRAIALANQTEDYSFRWFLLFALPRITLSADVIEFTEATQNEPKK